nr:MAG TPA: Protein of unknown function (DUF3139) [Caudoviricetes sp.]
MKKVVWIFVAIVVLVVLAVVYAHEAKMIHTFVAIGSFVLGYVARWAQVKYLKNNTTEQDGGNS